jgi:hypothetical protein
VELVTELLEEAAALRPDFSKIKVYLNKEIFLPIMTEL